METLMAAGVSCPVERMIVELAITPRNVRLREKMAGIQFPWFHSLYAAMKRGMIWCQLASHGTAGFQRYCERKEDALRRLSSLTTTGIHPADRHKYEAALDGIVGLFPPSEADRILVDYFVRRTLRPNSAIASKLAKKFKQRPVGRDGGDHLGTASTRNLEMGGF